MFEAILKTETHTGSCIYRLTHRKTDKLQNGNQKNNHSKTNIHADGHTNAKYVETLTIGNKDIRQIDRQFSIQIA